MAEAEPNIFDDVGPLLKLSTAQAWARQVQSDAIFWSGPLNRRTKERVLNVESRQVLFALAGALKDGSTAAVIELERLRQTTGFSGTRLNWCLHALRAGNLIGRCEQQRSGSKVFLRVPLNMGRRR